MEVIIKQIRSHKGTMYEMYISYCMRKVHNPKDHEPFFSMIIVSLETGASATIASAMPSSTTGSHTWTTPSGSFTTKRIEPVNKVHHKVTAQCIVFRITHLCFTDRTA